MAVIQATFVKRTEVDRITVDPNEPIAIFFQQEMDDKPVIEVKKGSFNSIDFGKRDAKLRLRQTTPVIVQGHIGGEIKTLLLRVTVR